MSERRSEQRINVDNVVNVLE